jgi:hypothetical protein
VGSFCKSAAASCFLFLLNFLEAFVVWCTPRMITAGKIDVALGIGRHLASQRRDPITRSGTQLNAALPPLV